MKKVAAIAGFVIVVLAAALCAAVYDSGNEEGMERSYGINGYSIVYCEDGKAAFQNWGKGIDEKSVFELASNGKVISAYIALKMVDEGKIALDDKIVPFLDDSLLTDDVRMNEITLKQLLCHTAGFSSSFELGVDRKLYEAPGEEFCYSGVGYIYLQNVIENVSGMTIEQAADYYVFKPLGMKNSTFGHTKTVTPHMNLASVAVYIFAVFAIVLVILIGLVFVAGKLTKRRFFSRKAGFAVCFMLAGMINTLFLLLVFVSKTVVFFGICFVGMALLLLLTRKTTKIFYAVIPSIIMAMLALGLIFPITIPVTNDLVAREPNCAYTFKSTSEDMSLFCAELMKQYDNGEAVKDMFSAAVDIDSADKWGLGIAIEVENEGETYWHSGINPGFQSLFVLYPLRDKYVIVLTNSDKGLLYAKEKARAFLEVDGRWEIKRER